MAGGTVAGSRRGMAGGLSAGTGGGGGCVGSVIPDSWTVHDRSGTEGDGNGAAGLNVGARTGGPPTTDSGYVMSFPPREARNRSVVRSKYIVFTSRLGTNELGESLMAFRDGT